MATTRMLCTLETMSEFRDGAPRILIAGGGVAGLESALALRDLCGDGVGIEMLAPRDRFTYRPLAVAEPFELTPVFRLDLSEFAADTGVSLISDELAQVDVADRRVLSARGEWHPYDYLIVAAGSRHAYFGHEEWETIAPGLKAIDDGTEMRRRFLLAFERAAQ